VAEQTRLHSDLARELLEALTSQDTRERILSVGAERAAKILGTDVMLLKRVEHRFKTLHSQGSEFSFEPKVLQFVGDHGSIAGPDTGSHESLNYWVVPLEPPSTDATVLLVKVPYGSGIRKLSDQLALLRLTRLIAQQISLALAQERSRRNAMDAIKERDEVTRRNQLLASIAHDMRTPLSTIVSSAHILTEAATDHRGRALLATIIDEATQMGRVTENALSMVRLQWGRRLISADWQSIEEIIGVVVSRYRNRVGQLPAVATLVDSNLPLVWVDGPLFSQLLDNLLQNAVRHSESNEPIDISARKIQDLIEIKVMDRGVGFSNEVLVAFEAMKGDSSPSTDSTPLGLGLAICNAIAGAHGAEIRLSNATQAQSGATTGGIAAVLLPVSAILKTNP
jgi:two-component system sensor histidine kinase KdpD